MKDGSEMFTGSETNISAISSVLTAGSIRPWGAGDFSVWRAPPRIADGGAAPPAAVLGGVLQTLKLAPPPNSPPKMNNAPYMKRLNAYDIAK